ncbi:MAG TPA: DUF86 domain-containing protein [Pontiellaceae bacterium]|nr:DUF86 domain-containing protein [Pontiellaceae bacterium]
MPFSPDDLIRHILDEIRFLTGESSVLSEDGFMRDEKAQRAFARSFEIIGEAAKKMPDDFKALHPEVNWKAMARMRDKLIHHYFGVDYFLVWNTVRENLPELGRQLEKLLI